MNIPTARVMFGLLACSYSFPLVAHEDHELEEIVVYGRAEQVIGAGQTASEGSVGYDDIRLPPLLRVGELVEAVPGMVATQHSGAGKANQYYLRGFNLDHGTDFSVHAEGVPVNLRTHGHGQGYLDLNFIIPELVATTHYRKGPYAAGSGDFSSAGGVNFSFYDRLDDSLAELSAGENGYYRALVATSAGRGDAVLTAAADITRQDGPWVLPENLQQEKLYLSYLTTVGGVQAKFTLQGYWSDWDATDQIPQRAVRSGQLSERGFIDPDLGGSTDRLAITGALELHHWQINAYLVDYQFSLFSNFTYQLDNPTAGDEFEQIDRRQVYGVNVQGAFETTLANHNLLISWGSDIRFDDINEVGLYRTAARQRTGIVRQDKVGQLSLGTFGEAEYAVSEKLRLTLGLRSDFHHWDVNAQRRANSGTGSDHLLSPKVSLAYRFAEGLEAYLNYGRGMHSNDVRGTTIQVDPATGEPIDAVDALVPSEGAELGFRFEHGETFNATVVAFWLELDSELVFVGDAGGTEANDGSRRAGIELSSFWQANDWLAINAAYTRTAAKFKDAPGAINHIPGAIESNATLGLNAAWRNGFSASLRLRHLGEAPLIEDDSVRADGSTLLNAGIAYRIGRLEWHLDLFNILDSNDYDIAYYYASRLPGEGADGVEDIHFHPLEPRTARTSLRFIW